MKLFISRTIAFTINLILPGYGLAALGHFRLGLLTQLCLVLTVTSICWSRAVFLPVGIQLGLGITALIYLISSVWCLFTKTNIQRFISLKIFLFLLLSLTILATGFIFKHRIFGIDLYFVPSESMSPTLKPGQFILIDSWIYKDQPPLLNDIVVFLHEANNQTLVKRIANWPDGKLQQNNLWYLLGDNVNRSRDSRFFGGVKTANILGQVRLVLLGIDQDSQFVSGSFLCEVY